MHTSYGSFDAILTSKGGESKVKKKPRGQNRGGGVDWLFVHGIVLWLAWFVFGLTMIGLTRWFVYVSDKVQYIHAIAGWAVTGATLFATILQVARRGLVFDKLTHSIAGTLMMAGVLPLALSGAHAFRTKENAKWSTSRVTRSRKVHRRLALLFWLLSSVALTSGLFAYARIRGSKWAMLAPLNLFAMLLITIGLEARFRWQRKQEDPFVTPHLKEVISEQEFEARVKKGEQLCILDDLVLDLSSYAYSHPGGAFLIDYVVGRDISKFFYGSYALDGNHNDPARGTQAHAHSNIARKIANRHAVGALARQDTQTLQYKIDASQTLEINAFTASFVFVNTSDQTHIPGI